MRTVFIIGAGANVEIGMPSGDALKTEIADILDFSPGDDGSLYGDGTVCDAINLYSRDRYEHINTSMQDRLVNAAINISKAMPLSISIDNFIEARKGEKEIEFCGKLAIVSAVLKAENNCALSPVVDETLKIDFIDHTDEIIEQRDEQANSSWYPLLFQKITEGCQIDKLAERLDDFSFIIFNYDRCFEYFMYTSLMVYYGIDQDKAKGIVQSLRINHPYGTVGDLWDAKGNITFGKTPDSGQLISLAKNIKTFTESVNQGKDLDLRIQYLVDRVDRIIFLRFAYHDQNLNLLFKNLDFLFAPGGVPLREKINCYGTGYNISDKDLDRIYETLQEKCKILGDCDISQVLCADFFHDFWYRLTFKSEQTYPAGTLS